MRGGRRRASAFPAVVRRRGRPVHRHHDVPPVRAVARWRICAPSRRGPVRRRSPRMKCCTAITWIHGFCGDGGRRWKTAGAPRVGGTQRMRVIAGRRILARRRKSRRRARRRFRAAISGSGCGKRRTEGVRRERTGQDQVRRQLGEEGESASIGRCSCKGDR